MSEERLYTNRQIAEALGKDLSTVKRRAKNEAWPYEEESHAGRPRRLYAFASLPRDVQQAIDNWEASQAAQAKMREIEEDLARSAALAAEKMALREKAKADEKTVQRLQTIQEGRRKFNELPKDSPRRERGKALEWLVTAYFEYQRASHLSAEKARIEYCAKVASGHIELPAHIEAHLPQRHGRRHLTHGALKNWIYAWQNEGIWGLVPAWGVKHPGSKIEQTPALHRLVLGALLKYPQITAQAVKDWLAAEHPELNICSKKGIQRCFRDFKRDNPQIWTYITHPDRWKNIYMAGVGSVFEHIDRPNQMWELDSTPGDWLLTDGRHSVVGCIDLHTRRVKLFVSKSSTAAAVKQVLRRAMLDWGMPEAVRTDNGKDYVSEDVTSLLRDLEIIQEICIPFASEEKGTIERFFRTMSHGILNLLDGFIGHNVAERKEIEARKSFARRIMKKDEVVEVKLSSDELQQKLDEWVAYYYEQNPHGGLKDRSPIEVWRAWNQPLRQISDPHALDELMAEVAGTRTIGKKGIRYDNRFYIDPAGVMHEHVGREVLVRLDEQDLGRLAIYLDGAFLCWAVDPDAQGIDRREAAAAIKGHVKKRAAEQAAELKQYTKAIKKDIVQTVIDHRKAQVENVVDMPKRAESHSTPALDAAGEAAKARMSADSPVETQVAEVVNYDQFRDGFHKQNRRVIEEEDERRIHAMWLRVEAAIEASKPVSDQDRRGLEIYKQSGKYRSMQEFFEAFGLTAADFA